MGTMHRCAPLSAHVFHSANWLHRQDNERCQFAAASLGKSQHLGSEGANHEFFRFQSGKLGGKDRFLKKLRNRDGRLRDRFYKNRGIPTISRRTIGSLGAESRRVHQMAFGREMLTVPAISRRVESKDTEIDWARRNAAGALWISDIVWMPFRCRCVLRTRACRLQARLTAVGARRESPQRRRPPDIRGSLARKHESGGVLPKTASEPIFMNRGIPTFLLGDYS